MPSGSKTLATLLLDHSEDFSTFFSDIREGLDEFAGFIFLRISSINALELDLTPCR